MYIVISTWRGVHRVDQSERLVPRCNQTHSSSAQASSRPSGSGTREDWCSVHLHPAGSLPYHVENSQGRAHSQTGQAGLLNGFCLFCNYSHATYVDHGDTHCPFPRPQSARRRLVASSSLPSAQACPKKEKAHQGNYKGKTKGKTPPPVSLFLFRRGREGGRGKEESASSPSASYLLSSPPLLRPRCSYSDPSLCASWREIAFPEVEQSGHGGS